MKAPRLQTPKILLPSLARSAEEEAQRDAIQAFDVHKHYTWARVERPDGTLVREQKIPHERGAVWQFLMGCEPGSPVAVETVGNWYWIVDEVETACCRPQLVHARQAKLMLGTVNKTDRLDARGLVRLQRTGTLPMVWIPPRECRWPPDSCTRGTVPAWKRPTGSVGTGGASSASDTPAGSMTGLPCARATRRRSWPSPGTWRKPRTGC
jgi:hypothetical protein